MLRIETMLSMKSSLIYEVESAQKTLESQSVVVAVIWVAWMYNVLVDEPYLLLMLAVVMSLRKKCLEYVDRVCRFHCSPQVWIVLMDFF